MEIKPKFGELDESPTWLKKYLYEKNFKRKTYIWKYVVVFGM